MRVCVIENEYVCAWYVSILRVFVNVCVTRVWCAYHMYIVSVQCLYVYGMQIYV